MKSIGTDLVKISRIQKILNSSKREIFLQKVYTKDELALASNKKCQASFFAGRFAAKEAVSKALECGIGSNCAWKDVNIIYNENKVPQIILSNQALKRASEMNITNWHLSISHDNDMAIAFVIAL